MLEACKHSKSLRTPGIVVARVTHRAVSVSVPPPDYVRENMEEDPDYEPPYDDYIDYKIQAVSAAPCAHCGGATLQCITCGHQVNAGTPGPQ